MSLFRCTKALQPEFEAKQNIAIGRMMQRFTNRAVADAASAT
jgi:hypothetical protein